MNQSATMVIAWEDTYLECATHNILFNSEAERDQHFEVHHHNTYCLYCKRDFVNRRGLRLHMRIAH